MPIFARCVVTFSLLFGFFAPVVLAQQTDIIKARDGHPIFIPAAAMYDAAGAPTAAAPRDWQNVVKSSVDLAHRHQARVIAMAQADTSAPCSGAYFAESDVESLVVRDSLQTTFLNAEAIFSGRIQSITPGFFYASAGSLLTISSVQHLKNVSYTDVKDVVLVRHPHADFSAGGARHCRETGPGSYIPRVGDEIIVFAFSPPTDTHGILIYSHVDDLVIQSAKESPRIPRLLRFLHGRGSSISELASEIRHELRFQERNRDARR